MTKEGRLPSLTFGIYTVNSPIVLGGMSVRIGGARLATAVTKCGGAGTIGGVGMGFDSDYFLKQKLPFFEADSLALRDELQLAHDLDPYGVYGVNLLAAVTNYNALVRVALENGTKYIVSGAGLPTTLPRLAEDYPEVALIPIVSSVQGLRIICKRWWNNHRRLPDAVVIEDPLFAGGHLGVTPKQDIGSSEFRLETVLPGGREFLDKFVVEIGRPKAHVPLIAAGGIWDGADIDRMLFTFKADGVQMATRFICTKESGAPPEFRQKYLDAKKEDIVIIKSPVGIPGRAIRTKFSDQVEDPKFVKRGHCSVECLSDCRLRKKKETYCIVQALSRAYRGKRIEDAIVFAGSNAYRSREQGIVPVAQIFEELNGIAA